MTRSRFDDLPERARFRLEQGASAAYLDGLGYLADFQGDVNAQSAFDLHDDRLAHEFLKAGLFTLQPVAAGQNIHERVIARCVGLYVTRFRSIQIRQSDIGVGNDSAAGIGDGSGDSSVYVLAPAGTGRERQRRSTAAEKISPSLLRFGISFSP